MPEQIHRGDVVLVDGFGQGWVSASIALGARLRYGLNSPHVHWSHVALVYDAPDGTDAPLESIRIVEATAARGVHLAFLSKYEGRIKIVNTGIGGEDFAQVREFLDDVLTARTSYGRLTYVGLTLYAVTGSKLCLQTAGTATCSGLVCDALTRAGFIWKRPPFACTPADIDASLGYLPSFEPRRLCRAVAQPA
jgi:hypothetical protein